MVIKSESKGFNNYLVLYYKLHNLIISLFIDWNRRKNWIGKKLNFSSTT